MRAAQLFLTLATVNPEPPAQLGLRERKKRAARRAMSEAALRLAMEKGVEQVRVEDIANAVGVSPRTFNNYFSSKEEAICARIVERQEQVREALLERPSGEPLWEAIGNAIIETYRNEGRATPDQVRRVRDVLTHPTLHGEFLKAHGRVEQVLTEAIMERSGTGEENMLHARLMAGMVESAVRVAFLHWLLGEGEPDLLDTVDGLLRQASAGVPALIESAKRTKKK